MADAIGCDPMSLIYDALVAEKVLWAPLSRNPNQDMPIDMLKHPNVSELSTTDAGGPPLGVARCDSHELRSVCVSPACFLLRPLR
jgi:hypothetical protein